MTQYKPTWIFLLAVAVALPATAATGRDAITTSQIAAAISNAGIKISAGQVSLLSNVVARTSFPVLNVQSIEPWGDHRMMARLDCPNNNECLPFYVGIRDESDTSPNAAIFAQTLFNSPAVSVRLKTEGEPIAVHAGSPAVLFLDGNHMHIEVVVICLEKGAIGQTIRVTSKDHRKTYNAEIFDGGVLKGKL